MLFRSVHAVKSLAIRPAVSATTGGAANVPVSIAEDLVSTFLSIIAAIVPVLIAVFLVLLTAWIVVILLRRARVSQ